MIEPMHEFNIDRSPVCSASANSVCSVDTPTKSSYDSDLDALEALLKGTGGREEVMNWEGICDEEFDLTHELLQDDDFVQVIELQVGKSMHDMHEVIRESSTPSKIISDNLLS
ncbi:unnamed protein product [Amaranthus hypochondriacus]